MSHPPIVIGAHPNRVYPIWASIVPNSATAKFGDAPTHTDSSPRMRTFYVYILASKKRGTLYVGVTNNIAA